MAEKISADALNYLTSGIQAEIAAYVFYKESLKIVTDPDLKIKIAEFAEQERKHFLALEKHYDRYVRSEKWVTYRDTLNRGDLPEIDESMGAKHVKRIEQVKAAKTTLDVLQIALNLEKEASELYKEAAGKATIADVKETFEFLMQFELGHVRIVEQWITQEQN